MTITIELNDLVNLQNETTAVTQINQNSETIEGGFSTALNVTGDRMQGNLDMNSQQIVNLPNPATAKSPLRLTDLNTFIGGGTIQTLPAGGSAGDSLVKINSTDYNVEWSPNTSDITSGNNIVTSGANPTVISTVTSPTFNVMTASSVVAPVPAGTLSGTALASNVVSSSLTSVGTITVGVWNATAISSAAGTLTGTTLAGNVVSSSLASVGTITTGTWNATAITATSLSGTTLANGIVASSLTSVGVLSGLSASAPIVFQRYTVTTVNAVSSPATGMVVMVTDALAPALGGTLTGGGTVKVLALYSGSVWEAV